VHGAEITVFRQFHRRVPPGLHGRAQACAVAEIGTPGSRTVNRTDEVCAEVILS
jgi:hypothetical protein